MINEILYHPPEDRTGEFIELYNRGIDPVDAAGLLLTDGDATDVIGAFAGGTTKTVDDVVDEVARLGLASAEAQAGSKLVRALNRHTHARAQLSLWTGALGKDRSET